MPPSIDKRLKSLEADRDYFKQIVEPTSKNLGILIGRTDNLEKIVASLGDDITSFKENLDSLKKYSQERAKDFEENTEIYPLIGKRKPRAKDVSFLSPFFTSILDAINAFFVGISTRYNFKSLYRWKRTNRFLERETREWNEIEKRWERGVQIPMKRSTVLNLKREGRIAFSIAFKKYEPNRRYIERRINTIQTSLGKLVGKLSQEEMSDIIDDLFLENPDGSTTLYTNHITGHIIELLQKVGETPVAKGIGGVGELAHAMGLSSILTTVDKRLDNFFVGTYNRWYLPILDKYCEKVLIK